jgi:hypothetical protein
MLLKTSRGAPGPELPESMPESVVSAMWKELWPKGDLGGYTSP